MKRFVLIVGLGIILSLMAGSVAANPASQSDPSVITADNIERVQLVGVFYHEDNDPVFSDIFLSADGRIATISDWNVVEIWDNDPDSEFFGEPLASLVAEAEACQGKCLLTSVALKDNHVAVGTVSGISLIFDINTGELLLMHREHQGHYISDITVNAEGDRFISIDGNGTVGYGIQMGENSFFQERSSPSLDPLLAVATDPTSNRMAVAGGDPLAAEPNSTIYMWNTDDVSPSVSILPVTEFVGSERAVFALEFSPDGTMLVSYEGDEYSDHSILRFWDVETGQQLSSMSFVPLDLSAGIATESITFSADGSLMGVKMGGYTLYLWETDDLPNSGDVSYEDTTYRTMSMGGGEVSFSADGRFLVTNDLQVIQVQGIWLDN